MDSTQAVKHPNIYPIHPSLISLPHPFYSKRFTQSPLHQSSEWAEEVSNIQRPFLFEDKSDIRRPYLFEDKSVDSLTDPKMSATVSQVLENTPSRVPLKGVFTTPGKNPHNTANSVPQSGLSPEAAANEKPSARHVHTADVLWAMLNEVAGKDKMAKFGQYSLRLLLHHSRKTQDYFSDDYVNIKVINATYASNKKVFDLILNFIRNPRAFARVVVVLTCSVFSSRLAGMVPALGLYRQLMRFGKSPFRIRSLLRQVGRNLYKDEATNTWKINERLFSKSNLGDLIGLYYNINDDSQLLYKLKFLRNGTWKAITGRHESYAWYCDSWFALYNAYNNLQRLSHQEMDMRIQIQVKKRSRTLSRQVLGGNALQSVAVSDDDAKDTKILREIQFHITNAKLDIYKTLSDIIFNSYTVFNLALPFDTLQMWMGISASLLSSIKLYREKKVMLAQRGQ